MNKKNQVCSRLVAAVAPLALFFTAPVLAETPLEGAWRVIQSESADGVGNEAPQPALFIFTSTHYSMLIATGNEPRAQAEGEQLADAEKLLAYDSFIANSGRYEMDGGTFKTRAYVAKSPDYMGGWPENGATYEFERDGDTLSIKGVGPANINVTLRRAEGNPVP